MDEVKLQCFVEHNEVCDLWVIFVREEVPRITEKQYLNCSRVLYESAYAKENGFL